MWNKKSNYIYTCMKYSGIYRCIKNLIKLIKNYVWKRGVYHSGYICGWALFNIYTGKLAVKLPLSPDSGLNPQETQIRLLPAQQEVKNSLSVAALTIIPSKIMMHIWPLMEENQSKHPW